MFKWLFGKKAPSPAEVVWMTDAARWKGVLKAVQDAPGPVLLLTFFPETTRLAREQLDGSGLSFVEITGPGEWDEAARVHLVQADRLGLLRLPAAFTAIAAENHPHPSEGRALVDALPVLPTFHASMDEPLLQRFGGDRLLALTRELGLGPEEPIAHPLISRALARAREKIGEKVRYAREAPSMAAWFAENVGDA